MGITVIRETMSTGTLVPGPLSKIGRAELAQIPVFFAPRAPKNFTNPAGPDALSKSGLLFRVLGEAVRIIL